MALLALLGVVGTLLWPWPVEAATTLDPNNPLGVFQSEGTQPFAAGSVLTLGDTSGTDFIAFVASDNDAAAGKDCDVIATFRVTAGVPANADAGNRIVINDGVSKSAIAECIVQNFVNGIGLYSSGSRLDPSSYPVFVPVDWRAAPVTIRLRRTASGDVELIEVNGVAPSPRALLTADRAPANTRSAPSVEFGSASIEAECTVEYSAFRSAPSPCAAPIAGCRTPAVGEKALLLLKHDLDAAKDKLLWKWLKGSETAKADFGTPLTTTDYALCLYDGTSRLIANFMAPAGGLCGAAKPKPCWEEKPTGYKYADKDAPLTPRRLQQIVLKEGVGEKATIIVKGKGSSLYPPFIPIMQPLTVQLVNGNGTCWEAVYSAPAARNEGGPPWMFKDKAD